MMIGSTALAPAQSRDPYVFVGTYTKGKSEGLYVFCMDSRTGALSPVSVAKGIANPSFVTVSPNGRFVYAVSEGHKGAVSAFRFDESTGTLALINTQPSGGASPCHLAVDHAGRHLLVSNYRGGNFRSFPIRPDGSLGDPAQTIQHAGQGADPARQEAPHVHSANIASNNRDLFVCDLGTDKIMAYHLDEASGRISEGRSAAIAVPPGSGPRHLAFHPNGRFAYVSQELNSTITAFSAENGTLSALQTVPALPPGFEGKNSCADIHTSPDGKFLYASNRGHNSLAIFRIEDAGTLAPVGHVPVRGKTPRNFAIDPSGKFLLVANQDSDAIQVFRRDPETGWLAPAGQKAYVPMPVCIRFY